MAGMVKGPAIFLAQFAGDAAPFNSFDCDLRMGGRARLQGRADSDLGRPPLRSRQGRVVEGPIATSSTGVAGSHGLAITELSTHLQGQLVAVNPAYDDAFDAFAPEGRCTGSRPSGRNGRSSR